MGSLKENNFKFNTKFCLSNIRAKNLCDRSNFIQTSCHPKIKMDL